MTIAERQANALANLLHELRPDWAIKPLLGMLWQHRDAHPFPELTAAAVTAANTPTNRTPAIIFLDGPHWHTAASRTSMATGTERAAAALAIDTSSLNTPARQQHKQFLTAAEKNRIQSAQMTGYYTAQEGASPAQTFREFISPSDTDPAALFEAFNRGQQLHELKKTQPQNPINQLFPNSDIVDEGETL